MRRSNLKGKLLIKQFTFSSIQNSSNHFQVHSNLRKYLQTMDFLQQFFSRVLCKDCTMDVYPYSGPRKLVAFGNVLLDRTVQLKDTKILDKFKISLNSRGELDAQTLAQLTQEASEDSDYAVNPGGCALNTVRIMKQLGGDAIFFGAVGADDQAATLRDILERRNIYVRLQIIPDQPTGRCICLVSGKNIALYANIGASKHFSEEYLMQVEQERPDVTFLRHSVKKQIFYIEGFFLPQRHYVCNYIVQHYIRDRRRLALNLSAPYIVKENFEQIMKLIKSAYFVFGNFQEYEALAKILECDKVESLGEKLIDINSNEPKIIVITHGAEAIRVITNYVSEFEASKIIGFQSFNVPRVTEVVDSTGAGDAFVAGFLHSWLKKCSLCECVRVASDVAAKVVTQIGCNLPA